MIGQVHSHPSARARLVLCSILLPPLSLPLRSLLSWVTALVAEPGHNVLAHADPPPRAGRLGF